MTETVQPRVPCSLRAIAKAFSAGTKRIFLTGLPRRPRCSTARGAKPGLRNLVFNLLNYLQHQNAGLLSA